MIISNTELVFIQCIFLFKKSRSLLYINISKKFENIDESEMGW